MTNDLWNAVWERVRSGQHVVVIDPGTLPPAPGDLKVLQVSCEAPRTSAGVLDTARRQILRLLGDEGLFSGPTPDQLEAGLRRRLLGELPGPQLEAQFVEVCNRLADRTQGRSALVFEAIDAADAATIETLTQILRRSGWLRLPLILTVHSTPQGPVAALIDCMRQTYGEPAVAEIASAAPAGEQAGAFSWAKLAPETLRVLRAGSVCGATFDAEVVASLLDDPVGRVLERLQEAADTGAPLADRGEGWFSLPPDGVAALQRGILPSLLNFWHTRLGEILSGRGPEKSMAGHERQPEGLVSSETKPAPPQPIAPSTVSKPEPYTSPPATGYAALFDPRQEGGAPSEAESGTARPVSVANVMATPVEPPWQEKEPPPGVRRPTDQARAAAHLQAAGRTEAAVEQYLAAVRTIAASGDARRAYDVAGQALQGLDQLPTSPRRALLRAELLLEMGRLQWHASLLGAPFTLQEALESLEGARSSLPKEVPPDILARLATTTAGVCYDLGDLDSLQGALAELTDVSRRLLAANEPLLAARLLNDQAAVYVRLGDPVRATHLLEESRKLFERRLRTHPDDAVAVEELAETHHLLARLLLHARIRPGREAEAYAMSLEHTREAELAYQRLGQRQQLARVWETIGRLESQRGQPKAAQERLLAALTLQRQLGDVIGLARTTAALAELSRRTEHLGDAVALLADSISLNMEKGSPLGLAVNRQAFDALARVAAQTQNPGAEQLRAAVAEVERRLLQAESILGHMELPGEDEGGTEPHHHGRLHRA